MSILRLPNEILRKICHFLCVHYNPQKHHHSYDEISYHARETALSRLSRVSRRFHAIATPVLYHGLRQYHDGQDSTLLFLRTIIRRPDLAPLVKNVDLQTNSMILDRHMPIVDEIIGHLGIHLPNNWESTKWEFQDSENDEDEDNDEDDYFDEENCALRHGFVADLLLSLVKNLKSLSLNMTEDTKYGVYMLSGMKLEALHKLHINGWDCYKRYTLCDVERLCWRAPNLEELWVTKCRSAAADLSLHNLTSLTFTESLIEKGDIKKLVKSCKALKSFRYHYAHGTAFCWEEWEVVGPMLTPKDIIEELSPCKPTLQSLGILAGDPLSWFEYFEACFVTTLKDYLSLKTLVVDQNCFYREVGGETHIAPALADLFPISIEVVTLMGVTSGSFDVVKDLERQARSLPNFKEFNIELDYMEKKRREDQANTHDINLRS